MFDSLIGFILIITPLVFFHELGHFLLARYAGVTVEVFSVGFGRELFGFNDKNGTRWRFSLFPIGGYVRMRGEQQGDSGAGQDGHFDSSRLWQRMSIVAAGPIANVLLALVILFSVNMTYGVYTTSDYSKFGIGAVSADSPAAKVGLLEGDIITSLNDKSINEFADILDFMVTVDGAPVRIKFVREDATYQDLITPMFVDSAQKYILGVSDSKIQRSHEGVVASFATASQQFVWLGGQILYGLGGLFSGMVDYTELGGPIKIAQYSGDVLSAGIEQFLLFAAMLSVNLALINMLPIPGLDGGHLLLLLMEGTIRRKLAARIVSLINTMGMLFVLGLIVLVSVKDVYELFI